MAFFIHQEGQGIVEYAFLLVLIAVAIVAVLALLGPQVGVIYSQIVTCVPPSESFCFQ